LEFIRGPSNLCDAEWAASAFVDSLAEVQEEPKNDLSVEPDSRVLTLTEANWTNFC